MNRAMQRYLGFGPEVIGTPLEEIRKRSTAPEPRLSTLLLAGLRGVEYSDCEVPLWRRRTADARARACSTPRSCARPDGSIDGVIAIGNDIERMRSLERQVIQAEKLATLGQLAAGVVHELNNPLTSISVYGDYLVRLLERVGEKRRLEKAQQDRRGRGAHPEADARPHELRAPVGRARAGAGQRGGAPGAGLLRAHRAPRARRRWRSTLADELPRVHAHPRAAPSGAHQPHHQRLHALPPTGGQVTLGTALRRRRARGAGRVADTGVGISALDRDHVFEPFFTTKKDGKGTGLGFRSSRTSSKGTAGGDVRERSGQGTTFVITLPMQKETIVSMKIDETARRSWKASRRRRRSRSPTRTSAASWAPAGCARSRASIASSSTSAPPTARR